MLMVNLLQVVALGFRLVVSAGSRGTSLKGLHCFCEAVLLDYVGGFLVLDGFNNFFFTEGGFLLLLRSGTLERELCHLVLHLGDSSFQPVQILYLVSGSSCAPPS